MLTAALIERISHQLFTAFPTFTQEVSYTLCSEAQSVHVEDQDGGQASGISDFHARDWSFLPVRLKTQNAQKYIVQKTRFKGKFPPENSLLFMLIVSHGGVASALCRLTLSHRKAHVNKMQISLVKVKLWMSGDFYSSVRTGDKILRFCQQQYAS